MDFKLALLVFFELLKVGLTLSECSYEHDIDYKPGSTPIDMNFIFSSSPQDCCSQCSATVYCKAWTYVILTKTCWLKSQTGIRTISSGRISGVKENRSVPRLPICSISSRYNYYGNDLTSAALPSASECCNRCGKTHSCSAWVFFTDYKYPLVANCYLKYTRHTNDRRKYSPNVISGELIYKFW